MTPTGMTYCSTRLVTVKNWRAVGFGHNSWHMYTVGSSSVWFSRLGENGRNCASSIHTAAIEEADVIRTTVLRITIRVIGRTII